MKKFIRNSDSLIVWHYSGHSPHALGLKKILFRWKKLFSVLIGFKLNIPFINYSGFNYYGYVKSYPDYLAGFETYLGKKLGRFIFLSNAELNENNILVFCTEADQNLKPQALFLPHWFQRLDFMAK